MSGVGNVFVVCGSVLSWVVMLVLVELVVVMMLSGYVCGVVFRCVLSWLCVMCVLLDLGVLEEVGVFMVFIVVIGGVGVCWMVYVICGMIWCGLVWYCYLF